MTTLRKIPTEEFQVNNNAIVDVVNRLVDEIQRSTVGGIVEDREVVLKQGVALFIKSNTLSSPIRKVSILNYRPVLPVPNNIGLEDYRIHDFNFVIENMNTVCVKAFWNNPDTFNKMKVTLRLEANG